MRICVHSFSVTKDDGGFQVKSIGSFDRSVADADDWREEMPLAPLDEDDDDGSAHAEKKKCSLDSWKGKARRSFVTMLTKEKRRFPEDRCFVHLVRCAGIARGNFQDLFQIADQLTEQISTTLFVFIAKLSEGKMRFDAETEKKRKTFSTAIVSILH